MNKKIIAIIGVLVILILADVLFERSSQTKQQPYENPLSTQKAKSPQDATYIINGENVTLVHGVSEVEAAPGSASKITTRYFGNEVVYDLNGDGRPDTAFILTQEMGGSGVFYYVVAALNTQDGYVGSHALFLGDRIAPQSTNMGTDTVIVVNYADRNPGESFAVAPSVGKSLWLKLDLKTMQFGEVVQNFEGEANLVQMTLGQQTWKWVHTVYANGTIVAPRVTKAFTLTFKKGTFSATTDCNGIGGEYTVNGNTIIFDRMMSTLMYCDGSQESDFTKMLEGVQNYHFTSKGELIFDLKFDTGSMIFN